MKLKEIKEILNAEVLSASEDYGELEVINCCACDLMSDVLALAKVGSILLTGLTNSQVIRTAELAEIKAVCFVRGKRPQDETVELAKVKNIPILFTKYPMFESCGRLYNKGLRGISEVK